MPSLPQTAYDAGLGEFLSGKNQYRIRAFVRTGMASEKEFSVHPPDIDSCQPIDQVPVT